MLEHDERPKPVSRQRISPEDSEYEYALRSHRVVWNTDDRVRNGCFGAFSLWRSNISEVSLLTAREKKTHVRKVRLESFEDFLAKVANKRKFGYAEKFVNEALAMPGLREEILRLTADFKKIHAFADQRTPAERLMAAIFQGTPISSEDEDVKDRFYTLIKRKKMPPELWTSILENHRERFAQELKKFDEEVLPVLKANFLERAKRFVGADILPISYERVEKTMNLVIFGLRDGLEGSLDDPTGTFTAQDNEIHLASHLFDETNGPLAFSEIERVFTHEMFHALSGQTIFAEERRWEDEDFDDDETYFDYSILRVGTRIGKKFWWLNEALTEYLSAQFLEREPVSYPGPIKLLKGLMDDEPFSSRIPLRVFSNAYFEHYGRRRKNGKTIPHWRALVKEIQRVHHPKVLLNFDAAMQRDVQAPVQGA